MKIALVFIILIINLYARENPFSDQKFYPKTKIDIPKLIIPKPIEEPIVQKQEEKPNIPIAKTVEEPKVITKIISKKVIPLAKTYPVEKQVKKVVKQKKRVHKKKHHYKKRKKVQQSKLIYNSKFLKIKLKNGFLKIITKDHMLQHLKLKEPYRLVFDFERFDILPTVRKKVKNPYIKEIKVGHHDYFYRITIITKKDYKKYTFTKTSYGYLVKL